MYVARGVVTIDVDGCEGAALLALDVRGRVGVGLVIEKKKARLIPALAPARM